MVILSTAFVLHWSCHHGSPLSGVLPRSDARLPVYDYATYSRTSETVTVEPRKVILVEGILIFENRALCDQMDIKIFVDTDADVRLIRRIRRDVAKRGRSLDSVLGQYLATVKPMHEQFVEPSKKNADLVVLEGGKNLVALEMIIDRIQRHIDSN